MKTNKPTRAMSEQARIDLALKQAAAHARKQLATQGLKLPTQSWKTGMVHLVRLGEGKVGFTSELLTRSKDDKGERHRRTYQYQGRFIPAWPAHAQGAGHLSDDSAGRVRSAQGGV
ncbi:MAG: hypothetical protein ACK40L_09025 [Hydrogenophaga sp.]